MKFWASGSLCLSHSVDVICIGIGILHVSQHSLNTELHYSPFQLNMAFVHLIVIIQSCNWYLEKIIISYSKFWFSSFSVILIDMPKKILQKSYFVTKLFWPTVRKKCSSDQEKLLKFEAEDWEFENVLGSLEQFILTVKGQNNFQ